MALSTLSGRSGASVNACAAAIAGLGSMPLAGRLVV